jgi:hypothetical protein
MCCECVSCGVSDPHPDPGHELIEDNPSTRAADLPSARDSNGWRVISDDWSQGICPDCKDGVLGSEAASEEDESKSESELSPEGRTRTRTTTRKRRRTGRRFALAKHSCDRGGYPAGRRVASENLYPRFLPARRTTYQPPRRGPLCVFERSRRTGRSAMAETGTVPRIAGE